LYWKSRQYDEAKREFERELANDPGHAQSLTYLGDIEMKRDNFEGALALLQKAVHQRNDIRLAYLDLGSILLQQKKDTEALKAFQRAVELDPSLPDAYYRIARIYQSMGKVTEAQSEFAKARELHKEADEDLVKKMSSSPPSLGPEDRGQHD
jgi:tetratricopeptide (TPR) repeat protein